MDCWRAGTRTRTRTRTRARDGEYERDAIGDSICFLAYTQAHLDVAEVAGTLCYDDVLVLFMASDEDAQDMMAALEDKTGVVGGVLKVLECENYVYNPDGTIGTRQCGQGEVEE